MTDVPAEWLQAELSLHIPVILAVSVVSRFASALFTCIVLAVLVTTLQRHLCWSHANMGA